jgi:hypothetical protein
MSRGQVYILINPAFPGLVKIGCTAGSPENRAKQLSATTGVPQAYLVAFAAAVGNMEEAERRVHGVLTDRGLRLTPTREFFEATSTEAINALLTVLQHLGPDADQRDETSLYEGESSEGEQLRQSALAAWLGYEDTLQDVHEAIRLFELAIAHGSKEAHLDIGSIYASEEEVLDQSLAKVHLSKAAAAGVPGAWARLASLFCELKAFDNALKCWAKAWKEDADSEGAGGLGESYLSSVRAGMPHKFRDELSARYAETARELNAAIRLARRRDGKASADDIHNRSLLELLVHGRGFEPGVRGTVRSVGGDGDGVIHAQDGCFYKFSRTDVVADHLPLKVGFKVEFDAEKSGSGEHANATNVTVLQR